MADLFAELLQKDAEPEIRALAATALGNLGASSHGELLAKAADDKHGIVRANAVRSLGLLGAAVETMAPARDV